VKSTSDPLNETASSFTRRKSDKSRMPITADPIAGPFTRFGLTSLATAAVLAKGLGTFVMPEYYRK
jgi:hypothetical protein